MEAENSDRNPVNNFKAPNTARLLLNWSGGKHNHFISQNLFLYFYFSVSLRNE
jgi:hypothetical protein